MKHKKGILALALAVLTVTAWFIGYHTRKSNDNLPSLASIAHMGEAQINERLTGYYAHQLTDVWGEADSALSSENTLSWYLDEGRVLRVHLSNQEKVKISNVDALLKGKILQIDPPYFLVEPAEGSPEQHSTGQVSVLMTYMDASPEPEVGDTVFIEYSGALMETYPAQIREVYRIRVMEEGAQAETVAFHEYTFPRKQLTEETLKWLDWYNALPEESQLSLDFIPKELRELCGIVPGEVMETNAISD